jgi:hypothetical protein
MEQSSKYLIKGKSLSLISIFGSSILLSSLLILYLLSVYFEINYLLTIIGFLFLLLIFISIISLSVIPAFRILNEDLITIKQIPDIPVYLVFSCSTPHIIREDSIEVLRTGDSHLIGIIAGGYHEDSAINIVKKIRFQSIKNISVEEGVLFDKVIIKTERQEEEILSRRGYGKEVRNRILNHYL